MAGPQGPHTIPGTLLLGEGEILGPAVTGAAATLLTVALKVPAHPPDPSVCGTIIATG